MAHRGSSAAACRNDRSASKYQNPCNCPIPWLTNFCTSGLEVVTAKLTGPVFPIRYARWRGPSLNVSPCQEWPAAGGGAGTAAGSAACEEAPREAIIASTPHAARRRKDSKDIEFSRTIGHASS